jgi:hypothetical protein
MLALALTLAVTLAPPAGGTASPDESGEPAAQPPEEAPKKPERPPEKEQPKAEPGQPGLEFDLLPPPKEKGNPELERQVKTRRQMLELHQAAGFATWAALTATVIVGQLNFNDRFRGGGDTGKYNTWHVGLAAGTSALFAGTGLLALLAPKPYPTPGRLDTATLHKILMGAATAGMVTQIVLGVVARGQTGSTSERSIATAHQIVGYTTLGIYSAGVVVFVF